MNACLSKSPKLLGRYNLIRRIRGRQVEMLQDFQPSSQVTQDIRSFARSLAPKEREIFNKIIFWFARFNQVYVTQSRLANVVGCSRKHVNRVLSRLEELGIIKIGYRHLTSCIYHLSSFFKNPEVCFSLSKIITSFWTLGLMVSCAGYDTEVTQLNYGYIYISSPCPTVNIVEELSPGDSAKRINEIELSKEKLSWDESRGENYLKGECINAYSLLEPSKEDSLKIMTKIVLSRLNKIEDKKLNFRILE